MIHQLGGREEGGRWTASNLMRCERAKESKYGLLAESACCGRCSTFPRPTPLLTHLARALTQTYTGLITQDSCLAFPQCAPPHALGVLLLDGADWGHITVNVTGFQMLSRLCSCDTFSRRVRRRLEVGHAQPGGDPRAPLHARLLSRRGCLRNGHGAWAARTEACGTVQSRKDWECGCRQTAREQQGVLEREGGRGREGEG